MKYIYLIQSLEDGYYKIGVSKHPSKRINELQTGNSSPLKLIETYQSEYANEVEKALHRNNTSKKKEGEWFDMSITDEVNFKMICEKLEKNIKFLQENSTLFI